MKTVIAATRAVLAAVMAIVTLSGCHPFDHRIASMVVNNAAVPVVVVYEPSDPEMEAVAVRVEPGENGMGLARPLPGWQGSRVTVMTTDCRTIGTVTLDQSDTGRWPKG